MAKDKSSKAGKSGQASMSAGMKTRTPSSSDKSTQLKMGPSVDSNAVRTGTAETSATIGPRC